jgi:Cell division protein FtsI/penicillin-binding protein 2
MRIKQIAGTLLLLLVSLQLSRGQFLNNRPQQTTTSLNQAGDSLTINKQLQELGERLLKNKQGSIVTIEPSTGKILALVNVNRIDDGVNRAIAMDYSPGSTFKVAQAITMLSEKALVPEKTYPCRKGFWYDKIHIGCHPHKAPLALEQAIAQSCNSYFCKAFQEFIDNRKLFPTRHRTIQRWHDYMSSMGLGQSLGVDIPGEAGGVLPDSASLHNHFKGNWNGTSIMWVGMGQGEVTTTPLQLCNLAAVIANRGYYITPHIHAGTPHNPLDAKYTTRHKSLGTPEAYDIVIRGMHAAVVNGTCASINTKDYKICGKTGTAENHGKDHSIFMGFAPMEKPRIAVSVYIENGGFGADLAAPIASLLIEQYINGKLSKTSALHASRWSSKTVKVTPVEKAVSFDDL